MNITAAVARSHRGPLVVEALTLDDARPDEIVVRLIACGVSRLDRDAIAGTLGMPLPFVPGGEGAGLVEHVGADVLDFAAGDAVLLTASACGRCSACAAGRPTECEAFARLNLAGRRIDGSPPFIGDAPIGGFFMGQSSFATHALCRARDAIKLPAGTPLELFAGLGGDGLIGANVVSRIVPVAARDSLVVAGASVAGLVAVMIAKARGASLVVVVDPDEARRALATELGATIVLDDVADLVTAVHSMAADGVRFAFETTGDTAMRLACEECLVPGGTCALLHPIPSFGATPSISASGPYDPRAIVAELTALYDAGHLPIEALVGFFPFEQVNDALAALDGAKAIKPVLRFSLGSFGDLDRAKSEGATSEAPGHDDGAASVPDENGGEQPDREAEMNPVVPA